MVQVHFNTRRSKLLLKKKTSSKELVMSRYTTDVQSSVPECIPSLPLPADHVLNSGAVLFPGAFDQHGCPLIMFPVDGQVKLYSELSKAEVVNFVNYFLSQHNKKQEKESLVSVVADLSHASLSTTRFIAETLLQLEVDKRTVHTVYIIQPKKKDVAKPLLKVLAPAKSCTGALKRVLLKEISALSNYIDRSQLTASLGGYFIYCHRSWVAFIKEIDVFVQEFLSVVQWLPTCISTLQNLSRLPLPTNFRELQLFCSTNEATFQQLRRELGLDDLLKHCESVVEKLRYPDIEPCYQAMAGTSLFIYTTFDMLQYQNRITAAVEKVELLWQQAFSQARLQLQVFQLREDALQITEQIETLLQENLHSYKIEIAKDFAKAEMLVSQFEASIHTPAMELVCGAEDVIQTVAGILPFDGQSRECWVLDLERLKEKLYSSVQSIFQTLRAVSKYHHYFNKAHSWYDLILYENFLQELLSGVDAAQKHMRIDGTIPAWRHKLSAFLKKNPPPDAEELVHLAYLCSVVPDVTVQQAGKQMSQRCMTLRKLIISSGPVAVGHLQQALHWQYELLWSSHVHHSSADGDTQRTARNVLDSSSDSTPISCKSVNEAALHTRTYTSTTHSRIVFANGKPPPSLRPFDSGINRLGSSQLETCGGRLAGSEESVRPAISNPLIHKENISSVSDPEDHRQEIEFGSVGNTSRASIQIIPKVTKDSLNFEIKVKRSAELPNNPWLSLPVDDLEHAYTVTITQNPAPPKTDLQFLNPLDPHSTVNHTNQSQQPTKTEVFSSLEHQCLKSRDCILHSQSSFEDSELSPIGNILSSTITDEGDESIGTTEGIPTLLWDSYDFHDQDAGDRDWDEKEKEGLREVEKILGRAGEILEEEENVFAQEAVLEDLLRSEDGHSYMPLWDSQDQLGMMSPIELPDAYPIGLDDCLGTAESLSLSTPTSAGFASETKDSDDDGHLTLAASKADTEAFCCRPSLLTELRTVQILDQMIMVENLKINELRFYDENPKDKLLGSKHLDANRSSNESKPREACLLQVENEKIEGEKLKMSLDNECKLKKLIDGARKVVKCSILDKARSDRKDGLAPCDELSEDNNRLQLTHYASLDQNEHTCKSENVQAEVDPGVAQETAPQRSVSSDCNTITGWIEREECVGSGESATTIKQEAFVNPEMRPHEKSFLPAVHLPSKTSLPVNNTLAEQEIPHSTYLLNPFQSTEAQHPCTLQQDLQNQSLMENVALLISHNFLNPNVKEHRNNSNNLPEHLLSDRLSEISSEDEEYALVIPKCFPRKDLDPTLEVQTTPSDECQHQQLAPQLSPCQPLEFDPGGRNQLNEDLPDGGQSSEALMVSGSGSSGIRTRLNINMKEIMDFKIPIVMDTGSGLMKAGFAGQQHPNIIFPTIIGLPKYEEIMNNTLERESYVGHEAQHMRGVLALKHPIKNGIISNWDDMEKIWHHTFQQLCVNPEDHPVLLTEAAMNPLENRKRMVEIMFECFNVPFTYVAMQAVLALYAAGRSTGVVFDSGDGVSHSVPVFEGYCLPHAVQRIPLAGVDVTTQLRKLLQEQGISMCTTAEMEIVREMKEKCCYVAPNYEAELTRWGSSCREMHYTMPDGHIVTLCTEPFSAPEILFKPELIGQDHHGIHKSVLKSIFSSDIDLRHCLLGNIVLSGGNTLLPGLPERLQAEIKCLVPAEMGESVRITSPKDRSFSVWSGGAVLANMPTFSFAWISREEYEEYGPQIVFRKCF